MWPRRSAGAAGWRADRVGALLAPTACRWSSRSSPRRRPSAAAAAAIGGAVALKAIAPGVIHKTDAGAVRLGSATGGGRGRAAREIAWPFGGGRSCAEGFLVQRMAPRGRRCSSAWSRPGTSDRWSRAPGGRAAELLEDVSVRLAPLSARRRGRMVRGAGDLPAARRLPRRAAADVAALEDVLVRVGALAEAHPEIAELDFNPVRVVVHPVTEAVPRHHAGAQVGEERDTDG